MLHGNMESTSFWESHVRNSGMSGVGTAEFFGVIEGCLASVPPLGQHGQQFFANQFDNRAIIAPDIGHGAMAR